MGSFLYETWDLIEPSALNISKTGMIFELELTDNLMSALR